MKKLIFFVTPILTLLLLAGSPFTTSCSGPVHPDDLVCYCCSGIHGQHIMTPCARCHKDHHQSISSWAPDFMSSSFDLTVFMYPFYDGAESLFSAEMVYPEVPVRPPITL